MEGRVKALEDVRDKWNELFFDGQDTNTAPEEIIAKWHEWVEEEIGYD